MTFGYGATGRMVSRANAKISEVFGYDAVGNLTRTRGFAYTYDAAGQMLTRRYSDGSTSTYAYDNDGRAATTAADGKTTTYAWGPAGRLTAVTSAKGDTTVTKTALALSPAGLPNRVNTTRTGPAPAAETWTTTRPTSSPPPLPAPRPLPTPTTRSACSATAPTSPIAPAARTRPGNPPVGCP